MKKVNTCWLLLYVLFFFTHTTITAQVTVECSNCPVVFFDNVVDGVVIDEIEIPELGINDLGITPLESVCIDITHSWLGDLFIVLESPGGKQYFLMGDDNNNTGGCGTNEENANVCFTLGADNPLSDGSGYELYCGTEPGVCLSGDWTVGCGPAMVSDLTPDATAAPNCDLNDFNEAGDPVSGIWRIYLGCVCGAGEDATLNNWSLNFSVPSFQPCIGSVTTDAAMIHQPCLDDALQLTASNGVEYEWTGPNNYNSTNSDISIPGFSDATAGIYTCKIITDQNCYDLHEIEVKNICQKEEVSILLGDTKEICVSELLSAGYVDESTNNGFLDISIDGNCLNISNLSPGTDSVYILENVGEEEVYHRYIVEAMETSATTESFPVNWQLSPNPTAGQLVLRTPDLQPKRISIVDLQGAVKRVYLPQTESNSLDLTDFPNGVYIVRVETGAGSFYERVAIMK